MNTPVEVIAQMPTWKNDSEALEAWMQLSLEADETMQYYSIDSLQEGANSDAKDELKSCMKEFKALSKECKSAIKAGNYSEAKDKVKKMKKVVNESKKKTDAILDNGDVSTAIWGYFYYSITEYFKALVLCLIPLVGGVAAIVRGIYMTISEIVKIVKSFQKGDSAEVALNVNRARIKVYYSQLYKNIDALEKAINDAAK